MSPKPTSMFLTPCEFLKEYETLPRRECKTCDEGAGHLDRNAPFVIFPSTCMDKDLYKGFRRLVTYYDDHDHEYKRKYSLAAITLTLKCNEVRAIKNRNKDPILYLIHKMESLGVTGVYIEEYTQKKVVHLHGITIVNNEIRQHPIARGYKLPTWDASNMIKLLGNTTAIEKWYQYCKKTLITADILDWLQ